MQTMTLLGLVTLAKTNANAVEMIAERLRAAEQSGDRKLVQQCRLALVHATRNAG